MFKSLGCEIATTCSSKNIDLLKGLGADHVIDYNQSSFLDELSDFDIAYDLLGDSVLDNSIEKCCKNTKPDPGSHNFLTHPFVKTLDSKGLILGTLIPVQGKS